MERFNTKFDKQYLSFLEEEIINEFKKDEQNGNDNLKLLTKEFVFSLNKFEYTLLEIKEISVLIYDLVNKDYF